MSDVKLILGFLIVSLAITYAWWVKLRIVILREDLFEIRDRLFDSAAALGALDNDAYRESRQIINGIIRFAHLWSWPVFLSMIMRHGSPKPPARTHNTELQDAIDTALSQVAFRLQCHLVRETLTGWVISILLLIVISPWRSSKEWLSCRIRNLLDIRPDSPADSGLAAT